MGKTVVIDGIAYVPKITSVWLIAVHETSSRIFNAFINGSVVSGSGCSTPEACIKAVGRMGPPRTLDSHELTLELDPDATPEYGVRAVTAADMRKESASRSLKAGWVAAFYNGSRLVGTGFNDGNSDGMKSFKKTISIMSSAKLRQLRRV